jgi:hypothetical protein
MAREPQDILKGQLGSLMLEIAMLTSALEKAQEEIAQLKAKATSEKAS